MTVACATYHRVVCQPFEGQPIPTHARLLARAWIDMTGALGRGTICCSCHDMLVQCPASCTDAACLENKVVTKGIAAPLEVFKTQKCG